MSCDYELSEAGLFNLNVLRVVYQSLKPKTKIRAVAALLINHNGIIDVDHFDENLRPRSIGQLLAYLAREDLGILERGLFAIKEGESFSAAVQRLKQLMDEKNGQLYSVQFGQDEESDSEYERMTGCLTVDPFYKDSGNRFLEKQIRHAHRKNGKVLTAAQILGGQSALKETFSELKDNLFPRLEDLSND